MCVGCIGGRGRGVEPVLLALLIGGEMVALGLFIPYLVLWLLAAGHIFMFYPVSCFIVVFSGPCLAQ